MGERSRANYRRNESGGGLLSMATARDPDESPVPLALFRVSYAASSSNRQLRMRSPSSYWVFTLYGSVLKRLIIALLLGKV